jgi:hypothetical protein
MSYPQGFPVAKAYDFTNTGEGAYKVQAIDLFYSVDPSSKTLTPILASTELHQAILRGELSVPRPSNGVDTRVRNKFVRRR